MVENERQTMALTSMSRELFYDLIDHAREDPAPRGSSADPDVLQDVLADLADKAVKQFALRFEQELENLNRWDIWAVGYIAAGGMSDDGFEYFRAWLIGKGLETVDAVLTSPDDLADFMPESFEEPWLENEELLYVATEELEERGLEDPRQYEDPTPAGEQFDEESDELYQTYPKTTAAAIEHGTLELES